MLRMLKDVLGQLLGKKDWTNEALTRDSEGNFVSEEILFSIISLLIEMSGRDQSIAPEEAQVIVTLIAANFDLPEREVPDLILKTLEVRKRERNIDAAVSRLNTAYSVPQRKLLLGLIWKIVLADGEIGTQEERFVTQLMNRLRIPKDEAEGIKEAALNGRI